MKLTVLFLSLFITSTFKCLCAEKSRSNDQSLEKPTQEETNQNGLNQRVKGFQRQWPTLPPIGPATRTRNRQWPPTSPPIFPPKRQGPVIVGPDVWPSRPVSPIPIPPWGHDRYRPPTSPPIYPGYEYDNYDDDDYDSSEQHVVGVGVVLVPSIWDNDLAPVMTIVVQKVFEWGSAHFGEGSRQKLDSVVRSAEKVSYMEIYVPEAIINGLSEIVTRVGNSLNRLYIDYGRNANSTIHPVPYGRHHTWLPLRDFTKHPMPIGGNRQGGMTWYPPPIIGRTWAPPIRDFEQRATPIGRNRQGGMTWYPPPIIGRTWDPPKKYFTFDDDFTWGTFDDDVTSEMPEADFTWGPPIPPQD
jgi:hypothetical protein